MKKLLIGIGHKKYSGKDTLATYLQDELQKLDGKLKRQVLVLHFSDEIYREVSNAVQQPVELIRNNKEVFRPLLQWWGAEYRRAFMGDSYYWINHVNKRIEEEMKTGYDTFIIPDVRYINEASFIKASGGLLIKVQRNLEFIDSHSSENELNGYDKWDMIVENTGSKEELYSKAKGIVNSLIIGQI